MAKICVHVNLTNAQSEALGKFVPIKDDPKKVNDAAWGLFEQDEFLRQFLKKEFRFEPSHRWPIQLILDAEFAVSIAELVPDRRLFGHSERIARITGKTHFSLPPNEQRELYCQHKDGSVVMFLSWENVNGGRYAVDFEYTGSHPDLIPVFGFISGAVLRLARGKFQPHVHC